MKPRKSVARFFIGRYLIAIANAIVLNGGIISLVLSGCFPGRGIAPSDTHITPGQLKVVEVPFVIHPPMLPQLDPAHEIPDSTPGASLEIPVRYFRTVPVHQGVVSSLAVSADGRRVFTGGEDGQVIMTSMVQMTAPENNQQILDNELIKTQTLLSSTEPIQAIALSPDQSKLAVAQISLVAIVDLKERKIANRLTLIKGRITALAWDPKGELLAVGRTNGDVFVWSVVSGKAAGQDSFDALEQYPGEGSSVVAILFHPSARAFFSAEQGGKINFWRLLRTEREIGLRDELALVDREKLGNEKEQIVLNLGQPIGQVGGDALLSVTSSLGGASRVEGIWLDRNGTTLFVAVSNGTIYPYKVRGLAAQKSSNPTRDIISSISGVELLTNVAGAANELAVQMLVASSRVEQLQFLCERGGDLEIIARSPHFQNPPDRVQLGSNSPILWATQKTGNLVRFDSTYIFQLPASERALKSCGA